MNDILLLINQWDPIDLFPMAPFDEYMPEVIEICKLLKIPQITKEELSYNINMIFLKKFGGDLYVEDIYKCDEIAQKILQLPPRVS